VAAVLAVITPGVAVKFILGALQLAAFLANPGAIVLAAFFAHIAALFAHAVHVMAQLGARDAGLGRSRQAQPNDQGECNQLGIHGYSPDWNGLWRVGLTLATGRKLGGKA
jgi:hypothetical protein